MLCNKRDVVFIRHKILKFITIIISIVLCIFLFNIYRSYYGIQINVCEFSDSKISDGVNLIIISDLHDHVFGANNDKLIEEITNRQPDGILMVGDILNKDSADANTVISLIEKLNEVAPVYYAMGNHELEWQDIQEDNLYQLLENAGAIVLEKSWCDLAVNGQKIRLGGLYDYAFSVESIDVYDTSNEQVKVYDFLNEFQDTDAFKIMLSHRPDSFVLGDASKRWDIDLVVSGHLHGGQVVLPFWGGVYGGDQGWFPEYVHGLYKKDNINILITSGLSTNKKAVPRWNNPPEIMALELLPEGDS